MMNKASEVRQLTTDEIDLVAGGTRRQNHGLSVSLSNFLNHDSIATNVAIASKDTNQTAVSGNGNKIYEFVVL